jgi:hypothetical protein
MSVRAKHRISAVSKKTPHDPQIDAQLLSSPLPAAPAGAPDEAATEGGDAGLRAVSADVGWSVSGASLANPPSPMADPELARPVAGSGAEPSTAILSPASEATTAFSASATLVASASVSVAAPVITGDTLVGLDRANVIGTAPSDTIITLYNGSDIVGTGAAGATGEWSVTTSPLPVGANFLTATATDAAGTVSAMSAAYDPVVPSPNPIVLENQKTGTPMSVWWVDPGEDSTKLEGFTTAMGTDVGGTVQFKIDNLTGNGNYSIAIYRLGYYGGDGARLITTLQHSGSSPISQPAPLTDPATGLVDAGNWSVTDSWSVPTTAVSGVYFANVTQGSQVFQIPFIISNPSDSSAILFQTSDETWQAYNDWGGSDVYGGDGPGVNGSAYAISYNRPITTRDGAVNGTESESGTSNDMVFSAEFAAIYWLEENGYDVSYIAGEQVATAPDDSLLLNHQVYMDVGHDEYWSDQQYENVLSAQNAGVNMMFWSGNEIYWQTRFAPSIDATADPNRTMITYKDTHANALIDPTGTATSAFMDARFASTGGLAGTPSNSLTGQVFSVDSPQSATITLNYGETQLSIWRNTAIQADTKPGQTASLSPGLLGYEWDSSPDNGFMPSSLIDLSSTTLQVQTALLDYGNTTGPGTETHNLVEFRNPVSGALVFGAGTVYWSFGLSDQHDTYQFATPAVDPNVQQAMVNEFADMGVQPQTLQASLTIAAESTDHTAPTSTITNVSSLTPTEGQTVTVSGTATDVGGVIGGVMVSTDGGDTWHPANSGVGASSVTWTYSFAAGTAGPHTLETKAIDSSVNVETPSDGETYTVQPSSNLTIFNSTDTPAVVNSGDPSPVEVGMKFVSATSGAITGIRFYKGSQNTGTHIGDLWSSTGQLLASATFTNETASGWQQVNFAQPVQIQAGQTYTASYHSNTGYSYTDYYFDNVGAGLTKGSLTAIGDGLNGVYSYGATPTFPSTVSFSTGDNYYVDVVFDDSGMGPQANGDSGFSVTENGSLSIAASQLLANDSDPKGLSFALTSVSNPVNGTVSYNAQTQTISFTPASGYAGTAGFDYTITDSNGEMGTGHVTINVAYPITAQSLFSTDATPSESSSGDPQPVEVGVKFTASVNGVLTGLRFYKDASNTGTHVADIWSSTGQLLDTATFSTETASGWQQVNFASPLVVTAGATYIASYHTNGNYSDTPNYFTSPVSNGQLTASASNGFYAYGAASTFPTGTFDSSNYWVDVVFDGSGNPVVASDSGFTTATSTPISINASQLLANDVDPNGLTLSISSVGNAVNGSVSYNSQTKVVTFTPNANYSGPASFTYSVTDSAGHSASGAVSLTVTGAASTSETLFSPGSTPSTITVNDPNAVELGVKFTADANGSISGVRFYKGPQNTGTHIADLWTSSGTLLATATFSNESASGWQEADFSSPVAITAGTTYVASYHTNAGEYSVNANYFTSNVVSGDLTAQASGNGLYTYSSGTAFPTSTYKSSNYWVDVVYTKASGPLPPVAHNDTGFSVSENTPLAINASQLLANDTDPNGLPLSISGVSNAVDGSVSYNSQTQVVTFTPNSNYLGPASFTYSIDDSGGGTAFATVSLNVINPNATTLFSPTSAPSIVTVDDSNAVELGVKFSSSQDGFITGIRFYKGPQNTGVHVGDLWSANGTLLDTATFANETASGWQEVDFAQPLAITAGTTYIAAYHTNVGEYSADPNFFANPLSNGPLTAPSSSASGGNGVYAYGADQFPNHSYNATNYGVDVVFKA